MLWLIIPTLVISEVILPSAVQDVYRLIQLPNGLKATVISCNDCTESGVAMSVHVGSVHDTVPGLAHFLEHMLFFASKTYPQEDYWTTYINTHGGYTNAFTEYEATVYFYSISHSGLSHSLHILSRAFAEPLFLPEAVAREINSVESEMQGYKYSDEWRLQKLMDDLTGSPLDHFSTGNSQSLSTPNITDELYSFWDKHYRAENLNLCVYGNFSLDEIEGWVREMYQDIRGGGGFEEIYTGKGKGNYAVAPKVYPGKIVNMHWKLEPVDNLYRVQDFIEHLINYALGTTLNDMYPGSYFVSGVYAELFDFSMLVMQGVLAESQIETEVVCGYFLQAVESLKKKSNETLYELWQDYQKIKYYEFYYSDQAESADLVATIAYNMIFYPEELYLAGEALAMRYSYEGIQRILMQMSKETALTSVLTDTPTESLPLYDAEYEMDYLISNRTFEPIELQFTHLSKNPYIPLDLKLLLNKFTEDLLLLDNSTHRIWFKYNTSQKKPKVMISALLFTQDWDQYKPIAQIHTAVLAKMISKKLRYWSMAGYTTSINVESPGVSISITGWNQEIFKYFEEVLEIFMQPNADYFNDAKNAVIRSLMFTGTEESYEKAITYLSRLITRHFLSDYEKYELVMEMTECDYAYYLAAVKVTSVDLFIFGNIEVPNQVSGILDKYFEPEIIERNYRKSLLIDGYHIFTAECDNENAILNWYEFGEYNTSIYMTLHIINIKISDQAYIALRSQAQLGYTVYLDDSYKFLSNALYLIVQGSRFTPSEMQVYIDDFWNSINFTSADLESTKSIIETMLQPPNTFSEIHEFIWNEILIGRFGFSERENLLNSLPLITLPDIHSVLDSIRSHSSELSIRMYTNLTVSSEPSIDLDYYRNP